MRGSSHAVLQQARAGAGAQPTPRGRGPKKSGPKGRAGPPGREAAGPEAAKRAARGGTRRGHALGHAAPERSKGDRSEAKGARSGADGAARTSRGQRAPDEAGAGAPA